ncbi:hypothetical protein NLG97_g7882 [Lecanicillium saksenae]|uniref:Uncharacterized protein n=1 Tax=Lecanicillium saksenae TaxID=468837 RepID=A0ACC1QL32_9HYPO|nr:hypothetical protein NLG97_g7882 [Lecanicillium saksenae]
MLPELYDDVISHLKRSPYAALALHLPSVGYKTEVPGTMQADAAFIASEVQKYADQGKDVVLVAHSYGGLPATESTKGLAKAERQKQGKSSGLVRLSYMSPMVLPVEESDPSIIMPDEMLPRAAHPSRSWSITYGKTAGFITLTAPSPYLLFLNDLPKEEAERWAELSTRHSAFTMPASLSHAGFKDVPIFVPGVRERSSAGVRTPAREHWYDGRANWGRHRCNRFGLWPCA